MIAKLVKGKGFRGALEYDLREQKGHILDTNMGGDNPRELAREFGAVRALRPNLTKAVCHVSISLPPDEKLTDDQWKDIAGKYLEGMGFKDSQYVVTKHTDTEHPHIHILANRVSMAGDVVSDSRDYQRQEAIMRRLEREYDLKEVTASREAERRAPTKGEIECAVRTGKHPQKWRCKIWWTRRYTISRITRSSPDGLKNPAWRHCPMLPARAAFPASAIGTTTSS